MNLVIFKFLLVLSMQLIIQEIVAMKLLKLEDKVKKALDKGKTDKAEKYLRYFGYLSGDFNTEQDMKKSLKGFQYYAGIPITGQLDDATVNQMQKPRCGMKDPKISFEVGRRRRYNLQGAKWEFPEGSDRTLTWYLKNSGSSIGYQRMRFVVHEALSKWQKVANINFKESPRSDKADIFVSFGSGHHGDHYPFDGPGGTLAHAFYPLAGYDIGGDMHFDNDETFTYKKNYGSDIMWVTVHEAGHSLGLEHSYEKSAIMYAWYQGGSKGDFDLTPDDIRGIQHLYGKRPETPATPPPTTTQEPTTTQPPTTTQEPTTTQKPTTTQRPTTTQMPPEPPTTTQVPDPPTTTQSPPEPPTTTQSPPEPPTTTQSPPEPRKPHGMKDCMSKIDAAVHDPTTGWVFVFSGENFYLASKRGLRYGPIGVNSYFRAVKGAVTAAYIRQNDFSLVLFAGDKYYIYKDFQLVQGERPVTDFGLPHGTKVDAALQWQGSSRVTWTAGTRTYLFTGTKYYRYNEIKKKIDRFYPRVISKAWRGLPSKISGAVTWFKVNGRGDTHFAVGNSVYVFNDEMIKVKPGYPRHISNWLKCWSDDAPPQSRRFPGIGSLMFASEESAKDRGSSP